MNIAVTSDIHGNASAFAHVISLAKSHKAETLLIAGDLEIPCLTMPTDLPIVMVKGNCDSSYDFDLVGRPVPPLVVRFPWNGRTIVMTHGDRYPSPYGLTLGKNDIFVFGHIHQSRLYRNEEGETIVNPGSVTFPRGGEGATYALFEPEEITIRKLSDDKPIHSLALSVL